MEPILKLVGTEIYILGQLQSSGLEGPAWADAVRKAEELEQLIETYACDHFAYTLENIASPPDEPEKAEPYL